MREFLETPSAQLVLWGAVLCLIVVAGWYLINRLRGATQQDGKVNETSLAHFRELHAKGELSDEEYRTIKSMLAARLQQASKDTAEKPLRPNSGVRREG